MTCRSRVAVAFSLILFLFNSGCATTSKVNWAQRIGVYTFDEAVTEYGPPDKTAELSDGSKVAEWLLQKGAPQGGIIYPAYGVVHYYDTPMTPDYYLRLTFGADKKLKAWKQYAK